MTYKGRDYSFTFRAGGLFRDVDTEITTVELSGQVYNLKNLEDFSGNYQKVEIEGSSAVTVLTQRSRIKTAWW